MRIYPAIVLSTLLLGSMGYAKTITADGTTNPVVDTLADSQNQVTITKNGQVQLTSNQTNSTTMQMYWLTAGASADIGVASGNLSLDFSLLNSSNVANTINFNVANGATLTFTNGKNGGAHGVFNGVNTTLGINITNGGTVDGLINNNGSSTITIAQGANLNGSISQTGGKLTATIDGTLTGNITANQNVNVVSLWSNKNSNPQTTSSTLTGNITIQGGRLEGILKGFKLEGSYVQSGGTSDIAFHHSEFGGNTTLSDANTTIHFYASTIKSITATNGITTINLKGDQNNHTQGSVMESYTGNNGDSTINLIEGSSMTSASQNGGSLRIDSSASEVKGSITGSNNASLDVRLVQTSTVSGSITNTSGSTRINSSNSTITGSISQTNGTLQATLTNSTIGERIIQNGGRLTQISATGSTISQGIELTGVAQNGTFPQLKLNNTTITNGGMRISNLANSLSGTISNNSTINGGFDQTGREEVSLDFSASTLNGGVQVRNGGGIQGDAEQSSSYATALSFNNGSTLQGGVTSNNHSIWLSFSASQAEGGNFTNTDGDIHIKGTNQSNLTGNLTSQGTGETHLHLDNSNFTGNIEQTNGSQTLQFLNHANLIGNITNFNTDVDFELRSNSELKGSYTQTNGTLEWNLGGSAIVHQGIILNDVTTTFGNGEAVDKLETFKGDLTQNGGVLQGNLEGLTLEGTFTQNGGETNITFAKANFQNPTQINHATLTKITFDNGSNLKTTTISDSKNDQNSFKLDHKSILEGNFILEHSSLTLSVINQSKITGSIISDDEDNDLKLDFGGTGNEIGGDIQVSGGNLEGDLSGTTVEGKLQLTDAHTHLHIIDSTIKGGIQITRGHTLMTLEGSTIGTGFSLKGVSKTAENPTLGLSINNASTIDGNLTFEDTTVALGGFGDNNTITGSLISTNSTLTTGGDNFVQAGHNPAPTSASGLTIKKELKQENGSFDLTFSNKSDIQGKTTLNNGDLSLLTLINSKMGELEIIQGKKNIITLQDNSEQEGAITLNNTTATIKALNLSSLKGNITATATAPTLSHTTILLDQSTLTGDILQQSGTLDLNYSNNSAMIGNINARNIDPLQITLNQSSITGAMTISQSNVLINMSNQSLISGELTLTNNPSFTLNAYSSTLRGDITHTSNHTQADVFEINLNFYNNSTFDNNKLSINGNMFVNSHDSQINSATGMTLLNGRFDISLSNSTGTIKALSTGGTNSINITTKNSSNSEITQTTITDNGNLALLGSTNAVLKGDIQIKDNAIANITSLGNANLKIDITPSSTSTLNITLNGGILEGKVIQTQPNVGAMTLGSSGDFGGRWLATGDSAIKSLNIINSSASIGNEEYMFKKSYDSPISLLDTTMDVGGISRVGLAMIKPGNTPQAGETLQRTITMGSLNGTNGVFRLYTDIGAEASDKITMATATGSHIVQVYYNPNTYTQDIADRYIVVAHVDDEQTTANFSGGKSESGTQIYDTSLTKVNSQDGGFDWILGKTQNSGPNYGTKVISSILQSQYRSFALQTESLRQRMGELRDINRIHGLWGRYTMGTTYTPESDVTVEMEDNFYSAWIGYDQNLLNLKGQDFYGFALSYNLVAPKGKDYKGNIHSIGFNFYNTFIARNDFYVDLVIKYMLSMADYEIFYYSLAKNTPEYINHKLMINAEIGKKFKLSESKSYFFLQPEAQVLAGYMFGNEVDFVDFAQTTIHSSTSGIAPVILRTGLTAGYSLNQGIKSDFYIGTSFFYETTNGGDVHLDDGSNTVDYSHKGTFKMSIQGGLDVLFTDNARIYFEAGASFFGKTNTTYSINAGARFAFGYKNTRKLIVPSSITPPPPPQEAYDPRNIPVITDFTSEDIRNNNSPKPKTYNNGGEDYFINTRKAYRDKSSTVTQTIKKK